MAGRIPDSVLRQIEQRLSLVDVVSDYLTLKKQGRNYVGLCPFHHEKTPSFSVSPEKGLFYCFGCGAGGGLFQFVMRIDNVEFAQAVQRLARRAGVRIDVPGTEAGPRQRQSALLAAAAQFFHDCLRSKPSGIEGRAYFAQRAIAVATIDRFLLGYCPAGQEFLAFLQSRKFSLAEAERAGLVGRSASGGYYPRFARRVVFPIRDLAGDVIAFGGRAVLAGQEPKYLNSPETAGFRKSEALYGLFEARQAVRERDRLIVVEGYLDALQLVQAGIENVAATMGTAWTAAHGRLARRFTRECVVLFDGDEAGLRAAERAFWNAVEAGLWPLGVFLPSGADPDSFVRERGAEAMIGLLEDAQPLLDFCLRRLVPPGARLADRLRAAHTLREALSRVEEPVLAAEIVRAAAAALGVPESSLHSRKLSPEAVRSVAPAQTPEWRLLEAMALDPAAAAWVARTALWERFDDRNLADCARRVAAAWEEGASAQEVAELLPPPIYEAVVRDRMGSGALSEANVLDVARDCAQRLEARFRQRRLRELRERLRAAEGSGDRELVAQLHAEVERMKGNKTGRT
jgi:DNA primase